MDTVHMAYHARKGSVLEGVVWMFIVSVLLFWLPVFGSLIAGFVGGKKAGGVGPAVLAVFVPALVLGVLSFVFATTVTGLPLIGFVAGAGGFVLSAAGVGPLLVGAIVGGALA